MFSKATLRGPPPYRLLKYSSDMIQKPKEVSMNNESQVFIFLGDDNDDDDDDDISDNMCFRELLLLIRFQNLT